MEINTKFDLNQSVWEISRDHERIHVKCAACDGAGRITLLDDKSRMCPECYGRCGRAESIAMKWQVTGQITIGHIRASITNIVPDGIFDNVGHYEEGKTIEECQYMCYETGIGSGTIHREDTLFSVENDAQIECDKRNKSESKTEKC